MPLYAVGGKIALRRNNDVNFISNMSPSVHLWKPVLTMALMLSEQRMASLSDMVAS